MEISRRIEVLVDRGEPQIGNVIEETEAIEHGDADLRALADETSPDDLATLIYTSGTTGPPKGVMISQYNVVYAVEILKFSLGAEFPEGFNGLRTVSSLPMAHIAERAMSHYSGMLVGYDVYCCPDPNQLTTYLKEVHPQILFGVPRVWEKINAGVEAALGADPEKKAQFDDGVSAAKAIHAASFGRERTKEEQDTLDFLDAAAFSLVRGLVGLDELVVGVTGAAPIPNVVLEWFHAIGVNLTEIYGMSESTGPLTWSPERNNIGSVGRGSHGMEVKLADDGEIICRGGNVFQGYLKQPDKTAETIIDGWLHSGDIGEIDDEGYFKVVDRKKELIITSGGKNISPSEIENSLKTSMYVKEAMVIGDGRKFLSALIGIEMETVGNWALRRNIPYTTYRDLTEKPEVLELIQEVINETNEKFARVENVRTFRMIPKELDHEDGELTATQKLKRSAMDEMFGDLIESMYS